MSSMSKKTKRNRRSVVEDDMVEVGDGVFVEDPEAYKNSKDIILDAIRAMPDCTEELPFADIEMWEIVAENRRRLGMDDRYEKLIEREKAKLLKK